MPMRFLLATVPLLALAAAACSSPCRSYCAKSNKCPSGFPEDCDAVCVQQEDTASHTNCASQYAGYSSCRDDIADTAVCTDVPQTRCATQATAYQACVQAYCAEHATDDVCRTPVP